MYLVRTVDFDLEKAHTLIIIANAMLENGWNLVGRLVKGLVDLLTIAHR